MAEGAAEPSSSILAPDPTLSSVNVALTPRAVSCAILLGSVICFANMYFGLQAGTVNAMPMQTALLGFALFRSVQHRLSKPLSPAEITVIEVVAGAVGLAPFTSGFTGLIPALEFLITPAENGPKRFSVLQLLMWSLATCFLGTVAAAPFRRWFILRQRLRYPSATATGTLIGVLFGKKSIAARAAQPKQIASGLQRVEAGIASEPSDITGRNEVNHTTPKPVDNINADFSPSSIRHAVKVLLISLAGSSLFGLVSYFIPILRSVPIFGHTAAQEWVWAFDLSPAYFGYGIIIGPNVNICMLVGAIVGWGILSPVAKHKGWAPGPVNDWDNGSRGWIVWVGMGLILGDSAIGLCWAIFKPCISWARRQFRAQHLKRPRSQDLDERAPLLDNGLRTHRKANILDSAADDNWSSSSLVTQKLVIWTGAALLILYFITFLGIFRSLVPPLAMVIAIMLVPIAGFISMRSLGETDNGAALAIGRVAQFIIGLLVPVSNSNYIIANLLLGGVVEAGASQASQQMGGLKTSHMTRTPPRATYLGQMVGSLAGTLIATLVYRIYTSVKQIPSEEFGIPDAHLWLVAAKLIYQQGLAPRALAFAIGAFVIGAAFSILRILGSNCWWRSFVPSGVAIAIGMYIVPAITLPRALGSLICVIAQRKFGLENFVLICSATGLILGQGIYSLVSLIFDALHMPHL